MSASPIEEDMSTVYGVREVFGTLQGEGAQAGSPAVFLRFAGCNLGYQVCPWCDTDWVKPRHRTDAAGVRALVDRAAIETFGRTGEGLLLVVTGGEPTLQWDAELAALMRAGGYRIAIETNGSRDFDLTLADWVTVSPKQTDFPVRAGDELKLVYTGEHAPGITPDLDAVRAIAEGTDFQNYFLQPVDVPERGGPNYEEAVAAVLALGPPWRLSVQTHKVAGIP